MPREQNVSQRAGKTVFSGSCSCPGAVDVVILIIGSARKDLGDMKHEDEEAKYPLPICYVSQEC